MLKPREYQSRAIRFIDSCKPEDGGVFLAMDIGLGKTLVAIKSIEQSEYPTLVVAPVQVCWLVWPDELKKWAPHLTWTVLHGKYKDLRIRRKRDVYICPYSSLKWLYHTLANHDMKIPRMNLILDESSYIKSISTQRFKFLKRMLPVFSKRLRLCLSATPAPNGLHELWSQYYMLDQGERLGRSFSHYRNRYFIYTGPPVYKTCIMKGSADKIQDKIQDITFRLDSKDYLSLPPITYNKLKLRLPPGLREKYNALEKEFFLELNGSEIEVFNAASLSMKLRQFLQGAMYTNGKGDFERVHTIKLSMLEQLIEASANQPILCVINFKFEYELMKKRFRNPPIIYGKTSADDKQTYIRKWNKGQVPLLLCHPASMSHGLNLQSGGRTIVWMALPWSLDQWHQLNGRLHRQGQNHAVVVNSIVFEDTVDEVIENTIKKKDIDQRGLLDALKKYSVGKGM